MALPQDIRPLNSELADSITRSSEIPWIETKSGMAWTKVLWVGQESGRWAVLLKWKKGYVAPPHKHLSAAFAFILSGKLKVRTTTYNAGDFLHETNGMVHGATEALEDTEYLFFCDGPVLFFDKDSFTPLECSAGRFSRSFVPLTPSSRNTPAILTSWAFAYRLIASSFRGNPSPSTCPLPLTLR